jgi:hypothetical protein
LWIGSVTASLLLVIAASWLFFGTYDVGLYATAEDGGYAIIAQVRPKHRVPIASQDLLGSGEILPTRETAPKPTPTPTPEISPGTREIPLAPAPTAEMRSVDYLAEARVLLEAAKMGRDERVAYSALETLAKADRGPATVDNQARILESQIYYLLDTLHGTTYLEEGSPVRWRLLDPEGQLLTNPLDFTLHGGYLYVIDSGTLYQGSLADLRPTEGSLRLSRILTPTATVGGYPVKEIVAVEGMNTSDSVFVLDKSNDLYRYVVSSGTWILEQLPTSANDDLAPHYINLSSFADRLYALDTALNQIWRHPAGDLGARYLPGTLPWLVGPGEPDVSSARDLAIDGRVYVVLRDGTVVVFAPAEQARFHLPTSNGRSHVVDAEQASIRPSAIWVKTKGEGPLYIADPGQRRVLALSREDGGFLHQWMAPQNRDFSGIRAIAEVDRWLLILAGSNLYAVTIGIPDTTSLTGELPTWRTIPDSDGADLYPDEMAPNDPRLVQALARYQFKMPIRGALLPDRDAVYPGACRPYRYGVHEGLDIYEKDVGASVDVGSPVYASAAGTVMRADLDYHEMTLEAANALLKDAKQRHITPSDTLDRLGGVQVWLDHGHGVVTKYMHLLQAAEGITISQRVEAGQLIGYVGLTGTTDGIMGNIQFPHLHFEISVGGQSQYYLGQWLSIEDTRRIFERIFGVAVRPAYLEFRRESSPTRERHIPPAKEQLIQ